jgi:hypothetical protein
MSHTERRNFDKETWGFKTQLEAWRQRFSQRDIFSMWKRASKGVMRERFAFTIVATQPKSMQIMDETIRAAIMYDAEAHLERLREIHGGDGLTPTTAAMFYVAEEIKKFQGKGQESAYTQEDIILSAKRIASNTLDHIWSRAVDVYPMSDESIGSLCFIAVQALRANGLKKVKQEFCQVVVLGAVRHCARAFSNKLRGGTPTSGDVTLVLYEIESYIKEGGRNPFDVPFLSKYGARAKQLRGLWEDAVSLVALSQTKLDDAPRGSIDIWQQSEEEISYSWVAIDPDEAFRCAGRNYQRLFQAARDKAMELKCSPRMCPPRLAAAENARAPHDVLKVALSRLPAASTSAKTQSAPDKAPQYQLPLNP